MTSHEAQELDRPITVNLQRFLAFSCTFQCMGFTGFMEKNFVKSDLGPVLEQAGYGDVKLMIFDDNRLTLPGFTDKVLNDEDAAKYVSGVGVHWYEDSIFPPSYLSDLHEK